MGNAAVRSSSSTGEGEPVLKKPKTTKAEDRRKSSGRTERRSLATLDVEDLPQPSALYTTIDDSLDASERFTQLLDKCFQHAVNKISEKEEQSFKGLKSHANAVVDLFKDELVQDGEHKAACETPLLKPNPKNAVMKNNLKLYQNTRARLQAEEQAWEEAVKEAQAAVAALKEATLQHQHVQEEQAKSAEADKQKATSIVEDEAFIADLTTQVEIIEHTAKIFRAVQSKTRTFIAEQQAGVASSAFTTTQEVNPSSLIRTITKTAPPA
eukprot:m.184214 g.184214  ORF g.184214 m.184214 type:complete len:268 (-) comp16664_c1_seq6:680-1483(-)